MLIEHILHRKGTDVATIAADAPVTEALTRLRERNVGALVVMAASGDAADGADGDGAAPLAGILSERDVVRALAQASPEAASTLAQPVSSLMSTEVTTCRPSDTVDQLMRVMTDRRIRHVPVLDGGRLAGIVSIGDVVKSRIDELQTETDALHEYLSSGR